MHYEHDDGYDQNKVDQTAGNMKNAEAQNPDNKQDNRDYEQHIGYPRVRLHAVSACRFMRKASV
jgi:hypothetical protein